MKTQSVIKKTNSKTQNTNEEVLKSINQFRHNLYFNKAAPTLPPEKVVDKFLRPLDGRIELFQLKKLLSAKNTRINQKSDTDNLPVRTWRKYLGEVQKNTRSIVLIVHVNYLLEPITKNPEYICILSAPLMNRRVSQKWSMCNNTIYANQPSAYTKGTGFFIKENTIATAAHIFEDSGMNVSEYRFIHGVIMKNENDHHNHIFVHKSQIYKAVEKSVPSNYYANYPDGEDWAILNVEPVYKYKRTAKIPPSPVPVKFTNRNPLKATPNTKGKKERIYSIGHGLGLPMKVSFDGTIIRTDPKRNYFECTLTLLGGNSGSPVFYADTHELAGIYIRGINKLIAPDNRQCYVVRNEYDPWEGQECQMLDPIRKIIKSKKGIININSRNHETI